MDSFLFDDRLFQRGRTWQECLESWDYDRDLFLESVCSVKTLSQSTQTISEDPEPRRLAILFQTWSLDALKCLPVIGATLQEASHLEVRYFDKQAFFSLFHRADRKLPKIFSVNAKGESSFLWGPRPESLTKMLLVRPKDQRDAWYAQYPIEDLYVAIDQELSACLKRKIS